MATLSEGNGMPYSNHYVGICSNQQSVNNLGLNVDASDVSKAPESVTLSNVPQQNVEESIVEEDPVPVIDVVINNVVCSFNVRCHLNLRAIALQAANVEYKRENGMVTMKIRKPYTTASIWSSGKVICTGATSEESAKVASRKFARTMQKLGFRARFANYRVVNVLGTCTMPFGIKISQFSTHHRNIASYEPELHPGVTYKIKDISATLKIFSTGSITITAPCVSNVQKAVEHIFPLVYEFRKEKPPPKTKPDSAFHRNFPSGNRLPHRSETNEDNEESDNHSDDLVVDVEDSDNSWD